MHHEQLQLARSLLQLSQPFQLLFSQLHQPLLSQPLQLLKLMSQLSLVLSSQLLLSQPPQSKPQEDIARDGRRRANFHETSKLSSPTTCVSIEWCCAKSL